MTYLHEVGHALGLGHPGNYNDNATFPYDALFLNDSWAASVMSYHSQTQNTFIASKVFDENFPATPMIADILAMSKLYGIANGPVYDTIYSSFPFYSGAICLFDTGGIDTIDATYQRGNQYISLVPGTYSNINGETGNVSIAFGTIIENAIGGAGNDTLIGNDAANTLTGGEGADTLFGGGAGDYLDGGAGADKLDGGPGDDRIVYDPEDIETQVKGGDGFDTLLVIDRATPYAFNLSRQGFEAAEVTQHYPGGGALSVIRFYTADWALKLLTTNYADLTHVSIQYDPLGVMDTYEVWNSYDADNRLSSTDLIFDNGTRTYINIDEDNSKLYTQDWFNYDAQGRLDSEDYRLDGGAHTFVNFDQANAFSWSQDWFNYDALGRLDSEDLGSGPIDLRGAI